MSNRVRGSLFAFIIELFTGNVNALPGKIPLNVQPD